MAAICGSQAGANPKSHKYSTHCSQRRRRNSSVAIALFCPTELVRSEWHNPKRSGWYTESGAWSIRVDFYRVFYPYN